MKKKILDWLFKNRLHFLCWIIYTIYESLIIGLISGRFGKLENYMVHYSLNISIFYLHAHFLTKIDSSNVRVKTIRILVVSIIEMMLYIPVLAILNQAFTAYNQPLPSNPLGITKTWAMAAIYRSLFFIIVSTGYWALKRFIREKKISSELERKHLSHQLEKESMEKSLIRSKNDYLRAQVNPHLIFNTLGFVFRKVNRVDEEAGEAILYLSEILRYATDPTFDREHILLKEEIEQVNLLIKLFSIKEKKQVYVEFDYDQVCVSQEIIPLALLTLVENIFKHGDYQQKENPVKISIQLISGILTITTKNPPGKMKNGLSLKTGLSNLKERLSSAYSHRAELTWSQNTHFEVKLTLQIVS